MLPGLDREARYNNESDFMKNHAWNISTQYTHTFWNGAKLTDRLSYNNDDINYFGTEALNYLESDDPIYDHYYMKTARKIYLFGQCISFFPASLLPYSQDGSQYARAKR